MAALCLDLIKCGTLVTSGSSAGRSASNLVL